MLYCYISHQPQNYGEQEECAQSTNAHAFAVPSHMHQIPVVNLLTACQASCCLPRCRQHVQLGGHRLLSIYLQVAGFRLHIVCQGCRQHVQLGGDRLLRCAGLRAMQRRSGVRCRPCSSRSGCWQARRRTCTTSCTQSSNAPASTLLR